MTTDMFGTEGVIGIVNFPYHTPTSTSLFRDFGLFTADGHVKQAYYTLLNQIQMFTTSGNTSTNRQGVIMFRGFAGNYTISVPGYESATIHVSEQGNNTFILNIKELSISTVHMITSVSTSLSTATSSATAIITQTAAPPLLKNALNVTLFIAVGVLGLTVIVLIFRKRNKPIVSELSQEKP